jgi:hypothetical protein
MRQELAVLDAEMAMDAAQFSNDSAVSSVQGAAAAAAATGSHAALSQHLATQLPTQNAASFGGTDTGLPDLQQSRPAAQLPFHDLKLKHVNDIVRNMPKLEYKGVSVTHWVLAVEERMAMYPQFYWNWYEFLVVGNLLDDVSKQEIINSFAAPMGNHRWQTVWDHLLVTIGAGEKLHVSMNRYNRTVPFQPGETFITFYDRVRQAFALLPHMADEAKIFAFRRWIEGSPVTMRRFVERFDERVHTTWHVVARDVVPVLQRMDEEYHESKLRAAAAAPSMRAPVAPKAQYPMRDGRTMYPAAARDRQQSAGVRVNTADIALPQNQADEHGCEKECMFCKLWVPKVAPGLGGPKLLHYTRNCVFIDHPAFEHIKAERKRQLDARFGGEPRSSMKRTAGPSQGQRY